MSELLDEGYRQFGQVGKKPSLSASSYQINGIDESDLALGLDQSLVNLQKASFGCIDGFSFSNTGVSQCVVGVKGVIYNGFMAMQYKDILNPVNTFKFTKFSNNLQQYISVSTT